MQDATTSAVSQPNRLTVPPSHRPTVKPPRSDGFTIIELLAVITLISLLMAVLFGAAQYVMKTARQRQAETTAMSLKTALSAYRNKYGHWPVPAVLDQVGKFITNSSSGNILTIPTNPDGTYQHDPNFPLAPGTKMDGSYNYLIFDMLRTNNAANVDQFPFIDEGNVFAVDKDGTLKPRYKLGNGYPLGYKTRDGTLAYFTITNWFELDKVDVGL